MPDAEAIALLHGNDPILRAFWASDRPRFYNLLRSAGVRVVTGPTFSVYDDSRGWPAAQSVLMMTHHHRVMDELYRSGFTVAPNLYWRRARDRKEWIVWLRDNPSVRLVSRDFSCTTHSHDHEVELGRLVELIGAVGRDLHVIVLGVGAGNAYSTLARIGAAGATCSLVTANPSLMGGGGERLSISESGSLERLSSPDGLLATRLHNMRVFEEWAVRSVESIPAFGGRDSGNLAA